MADNIRVGKKGSRKTSLDFGSKHFPPERVREFELQEQLSEQRLLLRQAVEARKEAELNAKLGKSNIPTRRSGGYAPQKRNQNRDGEWLARERLAQRERIQSRKQAEFQAKYNIRVGRGGTEQRQPQFLYSPKSRIERYRQREQLEKYEQEASSARAENLEKIVKTPVNIATGLHAGYKKGQELYHEAYGPIARKTYPDLKLSPIEKMSAYGKHYESKYAKPIGIATGRWVSRRFKPTPTDSDAYHPSIISTKLHAERNRQQAYDKERERVMQSLMATGRPPTPRSNIIVRKPEGRVVRDRLLGTSQPPMGRVGYGMQISRPMAKPTPIPNSNIPVGQEKPAKPSMFTRLKGVFTRKKEGAEL